MSGPIMPPRSRAAGLGRAVLDSFPLIKFGATNNTPNHPYPTYEDTDNPTKGIDDDIEHTAGLGVPHLNAAHPKALDGDQSENHEMNALPSDKRSLRPRSQSPESSSHIPTGVLPSRDSHDHDGEDSRALGGSDENDNEPSGADLLNQSAIGRETCPICMVVFENGDDLRVLPCEGRHRFHQACVDPWLLELSSSCPICRAGM